jgi:uncharacterized SAM-binding protein YcdF (DUF218 family)
VCVCCPLFNFPLLEYSLATLRDIDLRRLYVVTSRFHSYRSGRVFERALRDVERPDVGVVVVPVLQQHEQHALQLDFWRELLAIALYWVMGWL